MAEVGVEVGVGRVERNSRGIDGCFSFWMVEDEFMTGS